MYQFSPACERNKQVIADCLQTIFTKSHSVLEIGSGSGQHAQHFANLHRHLMWQPTELPHHVAGLNDNIDAFNCDNVQPALVLDVIQPIAIERKFEVVYTANTFHIMPWDSVKKLFEHLASVCLPMGYLVVYGPFKYNGQFTSESNQAFDQRLKENNQFSGVRDFEQVLQLALHHEFELIEDKPMPANNQLLVWQYQPKEKV